MMNKKEFTDQLAERVMVHIPHEIKSGMEITQTSVVKINDQKLTGLTFRNIEGKESFGPTIYIDQAFDAYLHGEHLEVIADNIAETFATVYRSNKIGAFKSANEKMVETLHENLKDKELGLRVLEESRNKEFLRDKPSMPIGNGFALVCDIRVSEEYSVCVTHELLDKVLAKSEEELFRKALGNIFIVDEPILSDMAQSVPPFAHLMEPGNLLKEGDISKTTGMYVLRNTSGSYGAAALFYPGVQERIADVLGESYYAIPSSLDEFLILPESIDLTVKDIKEMLLQANSDPEIVSPEMLLSDNPLRYDSHSKKLELAENASKKRGR